MGTVMVSYRCMLYQVLPKAAQILQVSFNIIKSTKPSPDRHLKQTVDAQLQTPATDTGIMATVTNGLNFSSNIVFMELITVFIAYHIWPVKQI